MTTNERGSGLPGSVAGDAVAEGTAVPESGVIDPAVRRLDETRSFLVGIAPAGEVVPAVGPDRYLHAGPPLGSHEVPAPMRGALAAVLVFEGRCPTIEKAYALLDSGGLELGSANEAGAVGAVAGVISPRMPVVVIESDTGARAFSPLNEGLGRVIRFGATDDTAIERLRWMCDELAPTLDAAARRLGPLEITRIQAEGLRRGDECHNRNVASSAALICRMGPAICEAAQSPSAAARVLSAASENPHFFLPFSMASAKAVTVSAHGVPGSPIVTAMASNGVRFGIRVSGCGDTWFTAPAPVGEPKLFDGFELADAHPAMGDSFITECIGLGACALDAAPAISSFLGTSPAQGRAVVDTMGRLTAGRSTRFLIPHNEYAGTPIGIDVTRVARYGIGPYANNGVAHREAGRGQVGAALTQLPLEPFVEAARSLAGREETTGAAHA
ncbi:MAG: DUF1116 domain-containing protein [Actinomadura sp.]